MRQVPTGAAQRQMPSVKRYNIVKSSRPLARRHGINPKTVARLNKRESTVDRHTGPTVPRSTAPCVEQEAIVVACRKHTLLPLNDCLYALQPTIPQLTRSPLHRCLERHGISRLPEVEGDKPRRKKFDTEIYRRSQYFLLHPSTIRRAFV